jgi:hypothetical protein
MRAGLEIEARGTVMIDADSQHAWVRASARPRPRAARRRLGGAPANRNPYLVNHAYDDA